MSDIYREQIIDHYKNPRNFGELKNADLIVKEANASCGDLFELSLKWQMAHSSSSVQANGPSTSRYGVNRWQIEDIRFKGVGCAISTASFSLLTERIMNKELSIMDVKKMTKRDMVKLLGIKVSPTRVKCVMLPLRALNKSFEEVSKK